MAASPTLAVIVGAGPGLGAAVGRAFSKFHAVALLARSQSSVEDIAAAINKSGGSARGFSCDVTKEASVVDTFASIKQAFPGHRLSVAVFNANSTFVMKPFLELQEQDLREGMEVNIVGAFHFSQQAIPLLLPHGGTLIFTGATASLKGSAKFAAFAPPKFALRALAQSLAREFHPQGVHVAHVVVDGIIQTPRVIKMWGEGEPDTRMDPDAMAASYVALAEQHKSSWTQELDLRPFSEKF